MCRLYGIRASHPTRVACELLVAQNALIRQSQRDTRGLDNPHGWGIATVRGGVVDLARQVGPADESEAYRREALESSAETVVAHIRRATVGQPSEHNTHPFHSGESLLVHNGHIGHFDVIRPRLLEHIGPDRSRAIRGSTDSEHFFHLVLAELEEARDPLEALRRAADRVWGWGDALDQPAPLFLNTLFVHRGQLYGTRLDRTLWVLERSEALVCPICGERHAEPPAGEAYRAVVLASERITDEPWQRVPEASVFRVTEDLRLEVRSLFGEPTPLPLAAPSPPGPSGKPPLQLAEVQAEVEALYGLFEQWFTGDRPADEESLQPVEAALDEDFAITSPRAEVQERGVILQHIRANHGAAPGIRIWTHGHTLRHAAGDTAFVSYTEWQQRPGKAPRGRLCSALLVRDSRAPRGLRWIHVHETWLPA